MQAISVLSTPTLLAAAGNRDFLHVYNNGSETIFLCYDGDPRAIGSWGAGVVNGAIATGTVVTKIQLSALSPIPSLGAIVLAGSGFPAGVLVNYIKRTGIGPGGTTTYEVGVTPFTVASPGIADQGNIIFNAYGLDGDSNAIQFTTDRGWPVPAGTWYNLDNDGNRNVFNKAVYAIAVTGPVDVRVQGV